MTTKQIDRQINLQKMHNARTKRAFKNIKENDKLHSRYGGIYTQAELNLIHDLHPGLEATYSKSKNNDINEIDIAEILNHLNVFTHHTKEDNYFMI